MDLEEFINTQYNKAKNGNMPNITKLNQELWTICTALWLDENTAKQQFDYLKKRIIESCEAIIANNESTIETDDDSMVINGYHLLVPSIALLQSQLSSENANKLFDTNYTHKRWDWTGRGKTTRHRTNAGQIVPIDKPFNIYNDKTGTNAKLMYPGDVNGTGDVTGNAIICYCKMTLMNSETKTASITNRKTLNGTILIDNEKVYNDDIPWNLTSKGVTNTFEALKRILPINVELGHLAKLDSDNIIYKELDLDNVATINDIEMYTNDGYSAIKIKDSTINNEIIKPLINNRSINGVSMNYYGLNTANNSEGVFIESMSLVNDPACPQCTIKMSSKTINDQEDNIMSEEILKQISELMDAKLAAFKEDINKQLDSTQKEDTKKEDIKKEPEADFKPDRFTEEAYKEQLKKEMVAEAKAKEAEDYVFALHKEGKLGSLKPEAAISLAQADLSAFKTSMEMASKSDLFRSVIQDENIPNTLSGRAKEINKQRFANR